jgi:acyl-CoA synthetase (NDP forming)
MEVDWCDAILSVVGSSAQFHPELAVKPLVEANKLDTKPLAVFLAPEAMTSLGLLKKAGIAAFRTPESCADALAVFFEKRGNAPQKINPVAWPQELPKNGLLTEHEASQAFTQLGVAASPSQLVSIDQPAHQVPYPVVVKISSRDVPHKTEAGGVKVGIKDQPAFIQAAQEIRSNVKHYAPDAHIDGLLVQQMQGRLLELILGYRHDALVGPTVILGAGGITAELSPDISIRLAPVTLEQAHEMINEVRITKLIKGYRGLPKGDCDALAQAVVNFSSLAAVSGVEVLEAEINPLFVQEHGVVAVDGLVRLSN